MPLPQQKKMTTIFSSIQLPFLDPITSGVSHIRNNLSPIGLSMYVEIYQVFVLLYIIRTRFISLYALRWLSFGFRVVIFPHWLPTTSSEPSHLIHLAFHLFGKMKFWTGIWRFLSLLCVCSHYACAIRYERSTSVGYYRTDRSTKRQLGF